MLNPFPADEFAPPFPKVSQMGYAGKKRLFSITLSLLNMHGCQSSNRTSCDVFVADGKHFAMSVIIMMSLTKAGKRLNE